MVFDSSIDLGTVPSFHYVHVVELRQCSIILIQTTEYSNLHFDITLTITSCIP